MSTNTQTKLKKLMLPQLAIIVILLTICVAGGIAIAKYMKQTNAQGIVRAEWFYFNSDLLKEGTVKTKNNTYTYETWTEKITFTLMSREDDLRYSDMDINYTVNIAKQKDDKTWDNEVEVKKDIIKANGNDVTITIDSSDIKEAGGLNGTYRITATGYCGSGDNKGYEKTLTAYITTEAESEVESKLCYYVDANTDSENDPYVVLLTVYAQEYKGKVIINYPSCLIPDNTDERMADVITGSNITDNYTFISNGYSSHTYRFFVNDSSKDRTVTDTGATIGGESFTVTGENVETSYEKPSN